MLLSFAACSKDGSSGNSNPVVTATLAELAGTWQVDGGTETFTIESNGDIKDDSDYFQGGANAVIATLSEDTITIGQEYVDSGYTLKFTSKDKATVTMSQGSITLIKQ